MTLLFNIKANMNDIAIYITEISGYKINSDEIIIVKIESNL